jgi:alkanesulfonate monooxygenase SsuD/methylene tetrahydromethanopterin reductase-like flavin-dependent oxidoreductase (luciferase family)
VPTDDRGQPGSSARTRSSRPSRPFESGSVSIRLYPHNELPSDAIISEVCAQARLALQNGFDGVMTSEHHGGFAGYMAQPLQMAAFVLEETTTGWAAAAPLLLPLRSTALVAEEVAWLQARHAGRVGIGVAAGALPLDFEVAGASQSEAVDKFKEELPRLVAMLRGEELGQLEGDPALLACRNAPVPVLSAAVSVAAAVRAAQCGAGILMEGMSAPERLARLTLAFDEAGGTGSKVLIRRAWVGQVQAGLVEDQRAVYESYATGASAFGADQTVASNDPAEVAERLVGAMVEVGADALNLRVQLPGMAPDQVREQIEQLGSTVVVLVKKALPSGTVASSLPDRSPSAREVVPTVHVEGDAGDLTGVV